MSEIAKEQVSAGVFARTSSGLVRSISTFDTFYYNLIQLATVFAFFNVAYWWLYPGSDMELASIIALVVSLLQGITYGLFSSVYPRSGGEYIPLSRGIHPLIGFVTGFYPAIWQGLLVGVGVIWPITFGLAPMCIAIGLQTGNAALTQFGIWSDSPWGWFIFGAILILGCAYLLHRGMSIYFRFQRWLVGAGLVGMVVMIIVLILGSTGVFDFAAAYNSYFGSGAYAELIDSARAQGFNLDPAFSMKETMWFTIWPAFCFLFAVLSISFGGEIKNVSRGQLIAMPSAQLIGGILVIAIGLFSRTAFSKEGLLAIGIASDAGQFPMPNAWVPTLASIMANNVLLTIVICLGAGLMGFLLAPSSQIYSSRGLLAFGIDGMGPKWLAKVHEKYHTPTNTIILTSALGLAFLTAYSFTDWLHAINALAGLGLVFVITTFGAALFPFLKRGTYQASPARIEVAGIPLMTITGLLGSAGTAYFVYRAVVDPDYGANAPAALVLTVGVFLLAAVWYYVARAIRRSQGVDMDARFSEIPIE